MRIARILFVAIAVIAALFIGARVSHAQTSGWLERSADREKARLTHSHADSRFKVVQQQPGPQLGLPCA